VEQQSAQSGDPFQSIVPIRLTVPPPTHSFTEQPQFYHIELCRKFNFVIDVERDSGLDILYSYQRRPFTHTQLVHRSGVAFIQIQGDSFMFVNNRLHLANQSLRNTSSPDPNLLMKEISQFCDNVSLLQTFWDSQQTKLDGLISSVP
jgi:hypothetical protein